jgi:hypothetical protein
MAESKLRIDEAGARCRALHPGIATQMEDSLQQSFGDFLQHWLSAPGRASQISSTREFTAW